MALMNHLLQNLSLLVAAMRRADASKAILDHNFSTKSVQDRARLEWKDNAQLLATEVEDCIDSITIWQRLTTKDDEPFQLVEMTYSFVRCLYIFYKQIRASLIEIGILKTYDAAGGTLCIEQNGSAYFDYQLGSSTNTTARIDLGLVLNSIA